MSGSNKIYQLKFNHQILTSKNYYSAFFWFSVMPSGKFRTNPSKVIYVNTMFKEENVGCAGLWLAGV